MDNYAKKYGNKDECFSDMFFPKWFTPIIAPFFTTLFIIGIILLITSKY